MTDDRVSVAVRVVVAGAALAWVGLLVWAPSGTPAVLSGVVYAAGSLICHQMPERSFHLSSAQLPVCARCMGLYGGAAIGALAWLVAGFARGSRVGTRPLMSSRTVRRSMIVVALPTAVSVAAGWAGWDGPNALRAIISAPLGAAIGALASAALARDLDGHEKTF